MADGLQKKPCFRGINQRLRAAVDDLMALGREPDPTAGFYISGERAACYALDADADADASALADRLETAAQLLGLSVLEKNVLAVCAAAELDPRYAKVFAFLHDDVTRKLPTARLTAVLLEDAETAPADDVDIDFLAARFKHSGGAIRNCSVAAAFEAAEAGVPIGTQQLVHAVAAES